MSSYGQNTVYVSDFEIKVDNRATSESVTTAINRITIEDDLNAPSHFRIEFLDRNWFATDLSPFKPGAKVEIKMGAFSLQPLLVGKVAAVESSFGDNASTVVRGYDELFELQFGTENRTFKDMKDSQIVEEVLRSYSLRARTSDSGAKRPFTLQDNISDYAFIMILAKRNNFEVFARSGELFFRESNEGKKAAYTFKYGVDMNDFSAQMKVLPQDNKVEVRGWDSLKKKEIKGTASKEDSQTKMGAKKTGYQVTQKAFSAGAKVPATYVSSEVVSDKDAKALAQARRDEKLNQFIEGEGNLLGDPNLRAGVNVELKGFGENFSGKYYAYTTTHTFELETGYQTRMKVRKTGIS